MTVISKPNDILIWNRRFSIAAASTMDVGNENLPPSLSVNPAMAANVGLNAPRSPLAPKTAVHFNRTLTENQIIGEVKVKLEKQNKFDVSCWF